MRNKLNSQSGFMSFKTAVILAVVVSLGYSGLKIGQFYFCYYDLDSYIEIYIRESHRAKNDIIKTAIYSKAKKLGIWIKPDDIKVSRTKDYLEVKLSYEEIFYISILDNNVDLKVFQFEIFRRQKLIL